MTDRQDMDALDALLRQVAEAPAEADPGFLDRLAGQARAAQPAPRRRMGPAAWIAALGGWPALGGLAAAAVTGLWIGVAPPLGLEPWLGGAALVELWPDSALALTGEG